VEWKGKLLDHLQSFFLAETIAIPRRWRTKSSTAGPVRIYSHPPAPTSAPASAPTSALTSANISQNPTHRGSLIEPTRPARTGRLNRHSPSDLWRPFVNQHSPACKTYTHLRSFKQLRQYEAEGGSNGCVVELILTTEERKTTLHDPHFHDTEHCALGAQPVVARAKDQKQDATDNHGAHRRRDLI
jgi:hypothetical protein